MSDVAHWLESVGFPEYARCFAENNVDDEILADLTDKDLQDIGVGSLGHRRKLLRAIGAIDVGDRHASAGPRPPLVIPATLNASPLARLDRLEPVYEIAQIGAALGGRFSRELIGAVAGMPSEQLDDALAQLVAAG